jgi:hypothetical protein
MYPTNYYNTRLTTIRNIWNSSRNQDQPWSYYFWTEPHGECILTRLEQSCSLGLHVILKKSKYATHHLLNQILTQEIQSVIK